MRYQLARFGPGWSARDEYAHLYFRDEYQIIPVLQFAIARVGDLAQYHLPPAAIAAVLGALAIGLFAAGAGRMYRGRGSDSGSAKSERAAAAGGQWGVIATQFALALAIAVGAAVLGQYPASATRHITYLGPAVFIFSGGALAAAGHGLAGRSQFIPPALRKRIPLTLTIIAGAIVVCASVVSIQQSGLYRAAQAADFFGILEQSASADDMVYISWPAQRAMSFNSSNHGHLWQDNYIRGTNACRDNYVLCIRAISNIVMQRASKTDDIFVIHHIALSPELERYDARGTLATWPDFRPTVDQLPIPTLTLLRFPADGGLFHNVRQEWLDEYRPLLAGAPAQRGPFAVYYNGDRLTYDRAPCTPTDTDAPFFLHLFPTDVNQLPDWARKHGFENRDFAFADRGGALLENRCIVSVALPDYDIARIRTGQYTDAGRIWEVEFAP